MTAIITTTFTGAMLATIYYIIKYYFVSRRPNNFPPGPPTLPFIGNLHQIPSSKACLKWGAWRKTYGDLIGLKQGPQNVIILNHYKHVKELFDKRGAIYSSRVPNHIGALAAGGPDVHLLLSPYGNAWRQQRKVMQGLLNISEVKKVRPIQNVEAISTLYLILQEPKGWYDHVRRFSTAVILASVYAQRGARFETKKVRDLYDVQTQFNALLEPGATPPVDDLPVLKYVPERFASWKTKTKEIRKKQEVLYGDLMNETRKKIQEGEKDCFMAKIISGQEKHGLNDFTMARLGWVFMEAGSDTTASSLLTFILAMIKYPAVLKKAQDEVDRVCGPERSPTVEDIDHLPYIQACVSELLRWRPVAPAGAPHVVIQDDVYEGYSIPKGTVLIPNIWLITRDEQDFDRPDEFIPERFLENKFGTREKIDEESVDHQRQTYAFGAGRRVCPGQHLAINALLISIAKMVWTFNITPGTSEVDVNFESAFTDGLAVAPKRFRAQFEARSDNHAAVIKKDFNGIKALLENFEEMS